MKAGTLSAILFFLLLASLPYDIELPNGIIVAKQIALIIITGLICVIASFAIEKNSFKPTITLTDILIGLYLLVMPFLGGLNDSIFRIETIQSICFGFIYFSIRIVLQNIHHGEQIKITNYFIITSLVIHQIAAILQQLNLIRSLHVEFNFTGFFFNPGPYGIYIASLLAYVVIFYGHLFWTFSIKKRLGLLLVTFTGTLLILASQSRSAWIGISISLLIFLFKSRSNEIKWFVKKNVLLVSILCLAACILIYYIYELKSKSALGRLLTWKATSDVIKENWLTGVGSGNFATHYNNKQIDFFLNHPPPNNRYSSIAGDVRYAFNDLMQIFAESGVFGLLLFLMIISMTVLNSRKVHLSTLLPSRTWNSALIAAIMVILFAGLTSYPLSVTPVSLLFWILIALLISDNSKLLPDSHLKKTIRISSKKILLGFLIIAGSLFVYKGTGILNSFAKWHTYNDLPDNRKKLDLFIKISPQLDNNPDFLLSLGILFYKTGDYKTAIKTLNQAADLSPAAEIKYALGKCYEEIGEYKIAELEYKKVMLAIPSLLKPIYMLAKLNYKIGNETEFLIFANSALRHIPKVQSYETEAMKVELYIMLSDLKKKNKTK